MALTCSNTLLKAGPTLKTDLTLKSGQDRALSSQLLCISKERHGQQVKTSHYFPLLSTSETASEYWVQHFGLPSARKTLTNCSQKNWFLQTVATVFLQYQYQIKTVSISDRPSRDCSLFCHWKILFLKVLGNNYILGPEVYLPFLIVSGCPIPKFFYKIYIPNRAIKILKLMLPNKDTSCPPY